MILHAFAGKRRHVYTWKELQGERRVLTISARLLLHTEKEKKSFLVHVNALKDEKVMVCLSLHPGV